MGVLENLWTLDLGPGEHSRETVMAALLGEDRAAAAAEQDGKPVGSRTARGVRRPRTPHMQVTPEEFRAQVQARRERDGITERTAPQQQQAPEPVRTVPLRTPPSDAGHLPGVLAAARGRMQAEWRSGTPEHPITPEQWRAQLARQRARKAAEEARIERMFARRP